MTNSKYHMVRKKLQIKKQEEIKRILSEGKILTLSLCRDNEPYVVTLSYGYDVKSHAVFFHCAKKGLKLDFIKDNPRICGTVVEDLGYLDGKCSHKYSSVVFWGEITRIKTLEEMRAAYQVMIYQLEKEPDQVFKRLIKGEFDLKKAFLYRIDIKEITGKGSSDY